MMLAFLSWWQWLLVIVLIGLIVVWKVVRDKQMS